MWKTNVNLPLLLLSGSDVSEQLYMATSEQQSVISRTHLGPSAGTFGLSIPIQGLNQSFRMKLKTRRVLKPHSESGFFPTSFTPCRPFYII